VPDQVSRVRNPLSLFGAWLTTLSAFAFIGYSALEAFGLIESPYAGILGYVLVPAVFVFGLLLIPLGIWREDRRRRHGKAPWQWPLIDLRQSRTRTIVAAVTLLTLVNVTIVAVAGTGAVHYTESVTFCGQVCHTPMRPEFTAHMSPPHANVACVECHVAPGAKGFVNAKMAGTRQLYEVTVGKFNRPIPSPARGVPHAIDTCDRCHTPGHPERDVTRVNHSYADDAANTDSPTTLTMHVADIHWHAKPATRVEYIASDDKRETIPYVRVTDDKGGVTEYFADGVKARPSGELRRMDCLDCHSRPAHTFSASADRAVNAAMASGEIARDLPFVHKEVVAAVSEKYPTESAAFDGIAKHLTDVYKPGEKTTQLISAAQRLYGRNVFPEMNVGFGTYVTQLGHVDAPGCFRCHDDSHKSASGAAIKQDCAVCHKIE